jgi:hypothetical protein
MVVLVWKNSLAASLIVRLPLALMIPWVTVS